MKTRIIALLMAFLCAVTLFGCAEEEEPDSIRRRRPKKEVTEATELVEEPEQTTQVAEETTAPPEEESDVPGSSGMPAALLMEMSYKELLQLQWDSSKSWSFENWFFQATSCDCTFTFVFKGKFKDPNAKASILNIERQEAKGFAYVTEDIQLGTLAEQLPDDVVEKIGPMDGGVYATVTVNGYDTDLLFDGEMDKLDSALLYFVQLRQEL